jgi:proteasome lid subunit RPN8/RPN11
MSLHRRTPLPAAPARGHLIVAQQVLLPTRAALQASRGGDGPHEGLVLWLGRTAGTSTVVLSAHVPETDHGPQKVLCDERAVGAATRAAHAVSLGVVAQVHSHPGGDTRHSDGDDQLILMPFENMFSLVAGYYGHSDLHPPAAGLHQYQDGRWVQVTNPDAMIIIPGHLSWQEPR